MKKLNSKKRFPFKRLRIPLFLILSSMVVGLIGCDKSSTAPPYTYPEATLELLLKEDSTSFSCPEWAASGNIYYIASRKETIFELWELDPGAGSKRFIKEGVVGPLAVSRDGKIAALLENTKTVVVMDSTGEIVWEKEPEFLIVSLAFSSDNQGLYLYGEPGGYAPKPIIFFSLNDSTQVDTLLQDAGPFKISSNDSFLIYTKETTEGGNPIHTFYKYEIKTEMEYLILKVNHTEGFDINPVSHDLLALGKRGDGEEQFLGRRILLYHMDVSIGNIFEAHPYEESYIYLCSWSPEGERISIVVTPFIPGNPIIPLPSEIWIVKDIL